MENNQLPLEVENEIKILQKKTKLLEANRSVHLEDSQRTISQQQKMIEKLKLENKRLKDEINLETKIDCERSEIEEVEKDIDICQTKAFQTRKDMGGSHAAESAVKETTKNLKLLENRLDQILVSVNEYIAQNRQLQEKTGSLHQEKTSLQQICLRVEKSLADKKKKMSDALEATNIAYEARDQAEREAASLMAQIDHEQALFDAEVKEIAKLIEADQQSYDTHPRIDICPEATRGSLSHPTSKASVRSSNTSLHTHKDYDEAEIQSGLQKAMQAANVLDLNDFVSLFDEREKRNFALFSTCNDMNEEAVALRKSIDQMKAEQLSLEEDRQNGWGNEMVKALNRKRDQAKLKTGKHKATISTIEKHIDDARNAAHAVSCRLSQLIKPDAGIEKDKDVLDLLRCLEKQASAVLNNPQKHVSV